MHTGLLYASFATFVGVCGCGCASTPKHVPPSDPTIHSDAELRDACQRAGAQLAHLQCAEAKPDFQAICVHLMGVGVPLHPNCLATITDCKEIDSVCK